MREQVTDSLAVFRGLVEGNYENFQRMHGDTEAADRVLTDFEQPFERILPDLRAEGVNSARLLRETVELALEEAPGKSIPSAEISFKASEVEKIIRRVAASVQ